MSIARQKQGSRLIGTLTCAQLAAATLHWIASEDSKKAYGLIREELHREEVDDLEQLVQDGVPNLT